MAKLEVKSESKERAGEKPAAKKAKKAGDADVKVSLDKYKKLTGETKRKIAEVDANGADEKPVEKKKPRLEGNGAPKKKPGLDKKNGKPAKNGVKKSPGGAKNGKQGEEKELLTRKEKKELKEKRRKTKLAGNYDLTVNMKKIWETLRRSDTTEDAKKKLCSSLFDHVKGRISTMAFAHDTCRVIECLVQYGNERHRAGVFDELKDSLIELSKSKYARFMIKKMLLYGTDEQKKHVVTSFINQAPKLIKHSFACQVVETIYNEYANYQQRNQMVMGFFDKTFALFNDQKYKTLADIIEAQPFSKEKILAGLKETLSSCVNKTILMFSLVHRVFSEYFQNCEKAQRAEMIDLLSEQLIHMVHTRDGAYVAMQCIWFGTAKDRKKIIKSMKTFVTKTALEEHGHMVILAIFDSVDDTKLVAKGILDELIRSTKELFENEYGRKVITYLVAPRDSRFFLKDYVKRLGTGDESETSKKDPEIRRKELLDHVKESLREYVSKEIGSLLYNGACGILIPDILDHMNEAGDEIVKKIANLLLKEPFEPSETPAPAKSKDEKEEADKPKGHYIEDATAHFIVKKILEKDPERQKKSFATLTNSLVTNENAKNVRSWIDCNRGCFVLVKMIESGTDSDKKRIKILLNDTDKELKKLSEKTSGAKVLLKKLGEI